MGISFLIEFTKGLFAEFAFGLNKTVFDWKIRLQ
jgi:hypothetical protein